MVNEQITTCKITSWINCGDNFRIGQGAVASHNVSVTLPEFSKSAPLRFIRQSKTRLMALPQAQSSLSPARSIGLKTESLRPQSQANSYNGINNLRWDMIVVSANG